ncbi:hypothetical protein PHLCEN_2v12015 [Hermanssonia centrifuga]|uniref:Uncharacterized protein n=1 Tax=Hermanssonia centrifuga TaxID=98765 RepID=A0A2R6NIC6_9APHY|nr:hypothetical protein PHLCEN_2v12015 [Hermanssonia centrifuga]
MSPMLQPFISISLGTRLALIISDTVILALTWRKTFTHRMEAARIGVETPLSDLLLRDAVI